jgi:plasma kallikrein
VRNSGIKCKCVVYYDCAAENSPQSTLDNRVEIDVSQNPNAACPGVLDVCCRDGPVATQRPTEAVVVPTEAVVVPTSRPPVTPPPTVTGCGVRNVGGLDFTLVGDFVSTLFELKRHEQFESEIFCRTTKPVTVNSHGQEH